MGGLGNGRRGGRSPPLMIGALIACILLLGFNYWMSSSRNLELQTKLYQLEGQVRRGAAERGVAEMKRNEFQEEIQRQKEQISHMESLFSRQLKGAQNTCSQEKGTLQLNISSSAKTIQELKGQLNQLNDDLGKLQKELQGCRGNIKTVNDRLTDDMSHCHSQLLSQKELCDERMAAAKLEFQKKMEKVIPSPGVSSHENAVDGPVKEEGAVITVANAFQTPTAENHTSSLSQTKENEPLELLTNEIIVDKGSNALPADPLSVKDLSKIEPQSVPSTAVKQDDLPPPENAVTTQKGEAKTNKPLKNNLTEDKDMELMDTHEEDAKTEEAEARMEDMLTGQGKAVEIEKPEELEEYDADEQVVGGVDLEKPQQSKQPENLDLEQELADYNGDDENEGEFEADKQAELAQI